MLKLFIIAEKSFTEKDQHTFSKNHTEETKTKQNQLKEIQKYNVFTFYIFSIDFVVCYFFSALFCCTKCFFYKLGWCHELSIFIFVFFVLLLSLDYVRAGLSNSEYLWLHLFVYFTTMYGCFAIIVEKAVRFLISLNETWHSLQMNREKTGFRLILMSKES